MIFFPFFDTPDQDTMHPCSTRGCKTKRYKNHIQFHDDIQGGQYVPVLQKVVIVRLVSEIFIKN